MHFKQFSETLIFLRSNLSIKLKIAKKKVSYVFKLKFLRKHFRLLEEFCVKLKHLLIISFVICNKEIICLELK